MSESKFTPGPWVINRDDSTNSCDSDKLSIEGGSLFIAQVDHCMHQEANARLIAAAPCLLEALRELVKINVEHNEAIARITGAPTGWKDSYLDAARAAIAKATASPMGKE